MEGNDQQMKNSSNAKGYQKKILGKTYTFQSKTEEKAFRAFLAIKLCCDEIRKNGKKKNRANISPAGMIKR